MRFIQGESGTDGNTGLSSALNGYRIGGSQLPESGPLSDDVRAEPKSDTENKPLGNVVMPAVFRVMRMHCGEHAYPVSSSIGRPSQRRMGLPSGVVCVMVRGIPSLE